MQNTIAIKYKPFDDGYKTKSFDKVINKSIRYTLLSEDIKLNSRYSVYHSELSKSPIIEVFISLINTSRIFDPVNVQNNLTGETFIAGDAVIEKHWNAIENAFKNNMSGLWQKYANKHNITLSQIKDELAKTKFLLLVEETFINEVNFDFTGETKAYNYQLMKDAIAHYSKTNDVFETAVAKDKIEGMELLYHIKSLNSPLFFSTLDYNQIYNVSQAES